MAELVETALAIVDAEGLPALTMRHLAATLGVEAMSLYHHVPNKAALLDLTVDRMRTEMRLPDAPPATWRDGLEAVFVEYHRVLSEHPNMLPLAARRTGQTGASGLTYLLEQGVGTDDAVEIYQSLVALTIGFSMMRASFVKPAWTGLDARLAERLDEWRDETFRRTLRIVMAGYSAATDEGRTS